jgi:hypothetical protein
LKALAPYSAGLGYVAGLRRYLRQPLTTGQRGIRLARQLANREGELLRILEHGVYANDLSPYRRLLEHADVQFGDVDRLVRDAGVENALGRLYDAGIHVTLDEFRGRTPICRPGLELGPVGHHDFDNPLLTKSYEAHTSGSRSLGTRVYVDLDLLAHEAGYHDLFLSAFALEGRPHALWFPAPPGSAGMKCLLRHTKLGRKTERWFAHNRPLIRRSNLKHAAFTASVLLGSRLWSHALPRPEHAPLEEAPRVARWLAGKKADGAPVLLETNWSSAVRVCAAARKSGLDIGGTFFRVGSETATEARAQMITETGSQFACHYAMAEAGHIGIACAAPAALNEVHVLADKLAIIERPVDVGAGARISSLHLTTLLRSCPKLMLNVDSGDYGTLERRRCGCRVEGAGLTTHLHGIASYEKLTCEGMTFLGSELITLVDKTLPDRFGGGPSHYQLVEEDNDALPRVSVVVSPTVGRVTESEVIAAVLGALSKGSEAHRMMADRWQQANTLRVVRREPYQVPGAKVLPLHRVGGFG